VLLSCFSFFAGGRGVLELKKPRRQLLISNALCTIFHVICAMQIMSATQPDTFFNVLLNTKIRQSANISMKRTVRAIF
jgi:hypothetical protein